MFLSKKRKRKKKGNREPKKLIPVEAINLHSFIHIYINVSKPEVMSYILWISRGNDTDLFVAQINFTLKIE